MAQKFQINQLNYKKTKLAAILSLVVILLSGMYFVQPFASDNSYAAEHTDNASGSYNGTNYSLSTTVSDLDLTLNALPSGNSTYGSQTVSVTTTAPGGYQLYVNTSGALASDVDSTTIPSVTGSNVALSTNTWGYTTTTPSHSNDTQANQDLAGAETIWNAVPTTITQIDSSSTATTNKTKTLYYGVKADNTLTDGNYNGTITYTTIANDATSDTLLLSPARGFAGTTVTITTPMMASSSLTASDITATVGGSNCTSITLSSSSPVTFTCIVNSSLGAGAKDASVTISKYNKTYTKSSAFTVVTLSSSISPTSSATAGQNTSVTVTTNYPCTSASDASAASVTIGGTALSSSSKSCTNSVIKITGTINKAAGTYNVVTSVTANGVTKNHTLTNGFTLTADYMHQLTTSWCAGKTAFSTSNVSGTTYEVVDARTNEKYWIRKFGTLCWMVENLYLPKGTTISTTNNYSKVNFSAYPTSDSTSGWSGSAGAKINTGSRYRTSNSGNNDGTWMNWYTATAGTGGDYGTSKAATSDICPTNWRLPTNSENSSIASTVGSGATNIEKFFVNSSGASVAAIRPGYYSISYLYTAGSFAIWWSSTQGSASSAYNLYQYSNSSALSTGSDYKDRGFSVRCVLPSS